MIDHSSVSMDEYVDLAPLTTLGVGGKARFFVRVRADADIIGAFRFAREHQLPIVVIGAGSNVLVSDEGFSGVVVKIESRGIRCDGAMMTADAGVPMAVAAQTALSNGLLGFTWAVGIPGTIGGSVRGNAGCFGGEMKDVVRSVAMYDLEKDEMRDIAMGEDDLGYRDSVFKRHPSWIVLRATLQLLKGNADDVRKERVKLTEMSVDRIGEQDIGVRTMGSAFAGVPITPELENHIQVALGVHARPKETCPLYVNRVGQCSAGFLVERAGLKGAREGDAAVSERHANFIVNRRHATANDVARLMERITHRVREVFRVTLREEIQRIGDI